MKRDVPYKGSWTFTPLQTYATFTSQHGQSLIDVSLTNVPSKVRQSGTLDIGCSDGHSLIYSTAYSTKPTFPARTINFRSYKTYDTSRFQEDLWSAPFSVTNIFNDPDDQQWAFQYLLKEVIEDHAPLKSKRVRARDAPFMNRELRKAAQNKTRLENCFKRYPTNKNWERYRIQRNSTLENAVKEGLKIQISGQL